MKKEEDYSNKNELIKDVDYYLDERELMIFTENYHLKRGYCCENNCKHCPYEQDKKF